MIVVMDAEKLDCERVQFEKMGVPWVREYITLLIYAIPSIFHVKYKKPST
jgi:hypothetical protein